MKVLLNYSNEKYRKSQKFNTKTGYNIGGFDKVYEFSPEDIDLEFLQETKSILNYKRGNGLWLWKPYFIMKTLHLLNDNDILFYCDSGAYFVNSIDYLVDIMNKEKQSIIAFELPLLERQFTKKETFIGLKESEYNNNQILASYIMFKKNLFTVNFVSQWLYYCKQEELISPLIFNPNIVNFNDFVAHREDQSIFSILYNKTKFQKFRDISQYGDRPFEYKWVKKNNKLKEWDFNPKIYSNSPYPRIVNLTRGVNLFNFKVKELIKTILNKLNIYNEKTFNKIHSIN
jgi:hypothetical protein